jgi:hypothetical protein
MDVGVMKNIENLSPHHYDTNMMVLPVDAQPKCRRRPNRKPCKGGGIRFK